MGRRRSHARKKLYKSLQNAKVLSGQVYDANGSWHDSYEKAGANHTQYISVRNGTAHKKVAS